MVTQVKICGISTPEAAMAALDDSADFLGFIHFPKSPRHIAIDTMADLVLRVRAMGRQTRLVSVVVDPSDELPDGRKFENIDELKELLLADKDQLARALTEKLLTYATGAAPTTGDRAEIESIVRRIADKNYGFRSLVHEIVQSKVFQSK